MKLKLTKEQVPQWVESTVDEIKQLLELEDIPYKDSWSKRESKFSGVFYQHQLVFPWCGADVVVGTLHAEDDLVINGIMHFDYPSIESYRGEEVFR